MDDGGKKKRFGLSLKSSKKAVSDKSRSQPVDKYLSKSQEKKCVKNEPSLAVNQSEELGQQAERLIPCQEIPGLYVIPKKLRMKLLSQMPVFPDWEKMEPIPMVGELMERKNVSLGELTTTKDEDNKSLLNNSDTNASYDFGYKDLPQCTFGRDHPGRQGLVTFENSDMEHSPASSTLLEKIEQYNERVVVGSEKSSPLLKAETEESAFERGKRTFDVFEGGNRKGVLSSFSQEDEKEVSGAGNMNQGLCEGNTFMDSKESKRITVSHRLSSFVYNKDGGSKTADLSGQAYGKSQTVVKPTYCSATAVIEDDYQDTWDDVDDEIAGLDLDSIYTDSTNTTMATKHDAKSEQTYGKEAISASASSKALTKKPENSFEDEGYGMTVCMSGGKESGSEITKVSQKRKLFEDSDKKYTNSTSTEMSHSARYVDLSERNSMQDNVAKINVNHDGKEVVFDNQSVKYDRGKPLNSTVGSGSTCKSQEKLVGVNMKTKFNSKGSSTSPIVVCDDDVENDIRHKKHEATQTRIVLGKSAEERPTKPKYRHAESTNRVKKFKNDVRLPTAGYSKQKTHEIYGSSCGQQGTEQVKNRNGGDLAGFSREYYNNPECSFATSGAPGKLNEKSNAGLWEESEDDRSLLDKRDNVGYQRVRRDLPKAHEGHRPVDGTRYKGGNSQEIYCAFSEKSYGSTDFLGKGVSESEKQTSKAGPRNDTKPFGCSSKRPHTTKESLSGRALGDIEGNVGHRRMHEGLPTCKAEREYGIDLVKNRDGKTKNSSREFQKKSKASDIWESQTALLKRVESEHARQKFAPDGAKNLSGVVSKFASDSRNGCSLGDNQDTVGHGGIHEDLSTGTDVNIDDFIDDLDVDDEDLVSWYDDVMSPTIPVRENKTSHRVSQTSDGSSRGAKRRLDMPEEGEPKGRRPDESGMFPNQSRSTAQRENSRAGSRLKECPICLDHFGPGLSSHDIEQN